MITIAFFDAANGANRHLPRYLLHFSSTNEIASFNGLGVGVGFAGVVIFIGADSGASGAGLWVYALPVLATASMNFVTLWERHRAAIKLEIAANTCSPSEPNMPIFTSLFWQGALTVLLLLPLTQQFENFAAD